MSSDSHLVESVQKCQTVNFVSSESERKICVSGQIDGFDYWSISESRLEQKSLTAGICFPVPTFPDSFDFFSAHVTRVVLKRSKEAHGS